MATNYDSIECPHCYEKHGIEGHNEVQGKRMCCQACGKEFDLQVEQVLMFITSLTPEQIRPKKSNRAIGAFKH